MGTKGNSTLSLPIMNNEWLYTSLQLHAHVFLVFSLGSYQNLNSGSRLIKGLNSSLDVVGRLGPSAYTSKSLKKSHSFSLYILPSSVSSSMAGSNFGERNAMNRLRRYIARAYVTMYHP